MYLGNPILCKSTSNILDAVIVHSTNKLRIIVFTRDEIHPNYNLSTLHVQSVNPFSLADTNRKGSRIVRPLFRPDPELHLCNRYWTVLIVLYRRI